MVVCQYRRTQTQVEVWPIDTDKHPYDACPENSTNNCRTASGTASACFRKVVFVWDCKLWPGSHLSYISYILIYPKRINHIHIDIQWYAMIWHLFVCFILFYTYGAMTAIFPTCQVRVVRFYVSLPASSFLPSSLLPSSFLRSSPDLNNKESLKIYQIECECQIACQNVCQNIWQKKTDRMPEKMLV